MTETNSACKHELRDQASKLEQLLPRVMRRLFTLDPEHPTSELPIGQLRVCSILQAGPHSLTSLSEQLGISSSAMTQIADRLERTGYVARSLEADDRRVRLLCLTPSGESMMNERRRRRTDRAEEALALLSPLEREALLAALDALAAASGRSSSAGSLAEP